MFGFVKEEDPRNRNFPLTLVLDPLREVAFPSGAPPGQRHYPVIYSPVLKQGNTGTCTAHGATSLIEGAPIMQKRPMSPFDLYRLIVKNDPWRDNDWEATAAEDQMQFGSSSLAVMKTLQQLGYVQSYLWAETAEQCRQWHLLAGVMCFGIAWKTEMMETDSQGFIRYRGHIEGGHFVKTTGWNDFVKYNGRRVPAVRIQNSWGPEFGQKGRCWMLMDDLQMAIQDDGDAVAPTEVRVKSLELVA
jgi:C1A family cysteine protease